MRVLVLIFLCTIHAQRADAGGAFLPPLELEYGAIGFANRDRPPERATQLLVGISWASLQPKPTRFDASVGILATFAISERPPALARGATTESTTVGAAGAFLDMAVRIHQRRHVRAWVGGRVELLGNNGRNVLGSAARTSIELWRPAVVKMGRGGGIMGALAVSLWTEVGLRERTDRPASPTFAAGLGVRLPFFIAY